MFLKEKEGIREMCQFQNAYTVLICPVASDQVCTRLREVFGDLVQCSDPSETGTVIQIKPHLDPMHFQAVTREAIETAQMGSPDLVAI